MALVVVGVKLLDPLLGQTLTTIAAVGMGVISYCVLAPLLGCLTQQDLSFLPGGRRLQALLTKLHIRL